MIEMGKRGKLFFLAIERKSFMSRHPNEAKKEEEKETSIEWKPEKEFGEKKF